MPSRPPTLPDHLDVDLAGLSAAVEPWVASLAVRDQRVQPLPDARNIRFYQTTGLLDRPARYDGRVARYGVRHLLQLVAIRALQAQGLTLAQIQQACAGISDAELRELIASAIDAAPTARTPGARRSSSAARQASRSDPLREGGTPLVTIELTAGVTVTIDTRVHPHAASTIDTLQRALASARHLTVAPTPARRGAMP